MELKEAFDKNYKLILVMPMALLLFSAFILISGFLATGEWFKRDIELSGGTLITLQLDAPVETGRLEKSLAAYKAGVKELRGLGGYGISISLGPDADSDAIIAELREQGIDTSSSSVRQIGSALGASFWEQTQLGILLAFIFMGIVVFFIFRDVVPSAAVILCAVSDIGSTFAFMQIFDIKLSLAALSAILMLIGYSVDTDILLTTNFLKKKGPFFARYRNAVITGLMMTLTSIGAMTILLVFQISPVITQIASVLIIGLVMDIFYTWLQNSILIRWYCERKGLITER